MKLDHRSFRLPESRIHPHRNRWYRTEHIKLVGRVDFAAKKLHGVISLRITPMVENLRRIDLDACAMEVRSVAIDGGQLPFDYDGEILSVSVAEGLNGTHELAVDYSTTSTNRGIYFIQPDAEVSDKPVQAWTHSEAEDARFWYPCNDQLTDRATSETVITIPERFRCISNGRLLSHEVRGGEATYHWQESTPHCTYLNSLAVGEFQEIKDEADGVPLLYYFDRSKKKDALRFFGGTPDVDQGV